MTEFNYCLVWQMKHDGRLPAMGKHEEHLPHFWWYTSWSGGHQLPDGWEPSGLIRADLGYDQIEKWVRRWLCPGRND